MKICVIPSSHPSSLGTVHSWPCTISFWVWWGRQLLSENCITNRRVESSRMMKLYLDIVFLWLKLKWRKKKNNRNGLFFVIWMYCWFSDKIRNKHNVVKGRRQNKKKEIHKNIIRDKSFFFVLRQNVWQMKKKRKNKLWFDRDNNSKKCNETMTMLRGISWQPTKVFMPSLSIKEETTDRFFFI